MKHIKRKPRGPQPKLVQLTERQQKILEDIEKSRTAPHYEVQRAGIILKASTGQRNRSIAEDLGVHEQTAVLWRSRWIKAWEELKDIESDVDDKELRLHIENILSDNPRSGCPGTFTAEQICQIVAVACENPELSGRPVSHWTPRELTEEVIKRGIVESISIRSVGRFLKRSRLTTPSKPVLA